MSACRAGAIINLPADQTPGGQRQMIRLHKRRLPPAPSKESTPPQASALPKREGAEYVSIGSEYSSPLRFGEGARNEREGLQHRREDDSHEDEVAGAAGQDEDMPKVVGAELAGPQVRPVGGKDNRAD